MRDREAVQAHLKIEPGIKWETFWSTSNAFFRSCSNLEFFNVSESAAIEHTAQPGHSSDTFALPPYLALKQAERHLLKFLSQIYPAGTIPFFESAYPLASVATEQRQYTYAVEMSADDITHNRLDIEDCSAGADAMQITVADIDIDWSSKAYLDEYTQMANKITEAVGLVRRSSVLPIIVHIDHPDLSLTATTTYFYLDLLSHVLSLAPEMMTVDLRLEDVAISKLATLKRSSKLIGHYAPTKNCPSWASSDWTAQYQRAVQLNCDLVRFIRPAETVDDNFEVARLRSAIGSLPSPHVPVIAYNSGSLGRHSACLNPVLTLVAPRTPSKDGRKPDTANLVAQAATSALYASFLFNSMNLYVFGANVSYSMSPAMHNAALEVCGVSHRYEPYSTNSLTQIKHLIQNPNFAGASIGLPFKVEFITLTDSLSPHAQAIGAINTLIPIRHLNSDGTVPTGAAFFRGVNRAGPVRALYGENTDWIGIRACIRRGLSPANAVRPATCALVVGAGGMARAAVYALLQVGVSNIAIYNRTVDNGKRMVNHFHRLLQKKEFEGLGAGANTKFEVLTTLHDTWQSEFRLPSIIISCIPTHPIGDVPSPEFILPESWLGNQTGGVIVELGYKTLNTPLLRQAMEHAGRGWIAMDGLDLLPDQGFAQFELFTGKRAPRRTMRKAIFENYPDQYGRSNPEELQRRLHTVLE
jgi:shikimate 5-dehydrogenase